MKKYLISSIVLAVMVTVALTSVTSGIVSGKAHVPVNQVQVCHKGRTAINTDAPALPAHLRHGDFQLPACDFGNVFPVGADCSFVSDIDNNGFADAGLNPRIDAGGITPACPAGTF